MADSHRDPALVSIVLSFRDAERFLRDAVHSVLAQTHARWELLLVDDGSVDASPAIARGFAAQHPSRVSSLPRDAHGHRGAGASRSLGLHHARGDFIAFLDAEDIWLPHKLERQLTVMQARPEVGMTYGPTQIWCSWWDAGPHPGRDLVPDLGVALGVPLEGPALLARILRGQALPPRICSMLVRRDVVQALARDGTAGPGASDDLAFVAQICLSTSLVASGECGVRHRYRPAPGASWAGSIGHDHPARRQLLEWLPGYLRARGIDDPSMRTALRKEIHDPPQPPGPVRRLARRLTPVSTRRWLRARWYGEGHRPQAGRVDFGSLRRLTPVSRAWGKDRGGRPVDRYYIERFLATHVADIRGRVLEVGDDRYTRRFGGDAVDRRDILHAVPGNPAATIVADLARDGDQLPAAAFDCVILTQVLHVIPDPGAAVQTTYRILRPGGVALATLAGISQISRWDMERWGDFWRFTTASARPLFASMFPLDHVSVEPHGNVLAATAFLQGLTAEEMRPEELDYLDPDYQVLITVRAVKPRSAVSGGDGILADQDQLATALTATRPWGR